MEDFCGNLGQKASQSPSSSVPQMSRVDTSDLGKYLGMALLHSRVTKTTYGKILDKVRRKLASWKGKCLSFAGRVIVIKSVISAIPTYAMQSTKLPNTLVEAIEKEARRFLWGDTDEGRKLHQVSWRTITLPNDYGGLGIRRLSQANRAMLAKLSWRSVKYPEALWAKVLNTKYGHERNNFKFEKRLGESWKSIREGCTFMKKGIKWRVVMEGKLDFGLILE